MKDQPVQAFKQFSNLGQGWGQVLPLLFVALLLFTSCGASEKKASFTLVTGTLDDEAIGRVYLVKDKGVLGLQAVDSTQVLAKYFGFAVPDLEEGYYRLQSSSAENPQPAFLAGLYLLQGEDLQINFENGVPSYHGTTAHLQEYGEKSWDFIGKDSLYQTLYQPRYEIAKLGLDEATSFMESIREKRLGFFEDYFRDSLLPEKFEILERAKVEVDIARKHFMYLRFHRYMTEEEIFGYLQVDPTYYTFLDRVDLTADVNLELPFPYVWFLQEYATDAFIRKHGKYGYYGGEGEPESIKEEFTFKRNWIREHLHGVNRDLGYFSLLNGPFIPKAFKYAPEYFFQELSHLRSNLEEDGQDSALVSRCTQICESYLKIQTGAPAPALILPDSSGSLVSLDSFEGKVVYLDFWGSWCGPCIQAIPDHRILQKEFKDQDVVFLSIAMEVDEKGIEDWKQFLAENDFPGVHVVAENQFRNEEIKPYLINFAPTYVLIDKAGNIAAPRAPKPAAAAEAIRDLLSM